MRTDLVMGVDAPGDDTLDGVTVRLHYGARSRETGLFHFNGRTNQSEPENSALSQLDVPARVPEYSNLIAIRKSSLTAAEKLGLPFTPDSWPIASSTQGIVGYLPGVWLGGKRAWSGKVSNQRWLLIPERDSAILDDYNARRTYRDFYWQLQHPALQLSQALIMNPRTPFSTLLWLASCSLILKVDQFVEWQDRAYTAGRVLAVDVKAALRERLWDEHGWWGDWFKEGIADPNTGVDLFLKRKDVQAKLTHS